MVAYIKKLWSDIYSQKFLFRVVDVVLLSIPFIVMQVYIMILAMRVNYISFAIVTPNLLFNVLWIGFIVFVTLNMKKWFGRIFYLLCFLVFFCIVFDKLYLFFIYGILFQLQYDEVGRRRKCIYLGYRA